MDLTPDQLYYALYGGYPSTEVDQSTEPSGSVFGRGLEHLGNLPSNILNTGMQAAVNMGVAPTSRKVPRIFDIPQAKTTTEKVVDAIGEHLLPQLGWAAATYGLGGALGKAAGLTEAGAALGLSEAGALTRSGTVAADVIGNVTSGFASGATQSPDQAVMGALFGGAYGAGSWLPRAQRVLPMVGIGAADAMAAYAQSGDIGMSTLQGGLGAGIGMLPHGLHPELPEVLTGSERGRAMQFDPQRPHWPGAASTEDIPLGPYGPPMTKVTGDQIGFSRRMSGVDPDPGLAWPDILQPGESPYPPAGPPKRPMRIPGYPNPDPGVASSDITREGSLLGIGHINRYENSYDRSNEVETLQALGFNPPVRPKRPAQVSANAIMKQGGGSLPITQEESLINAATSSIDQDEATKNIMRQLGLLDENVDEETIKRLLPEFLKEDPERLMRLRNQHALVTLQKEAENIVYPTGTTKREVIDLARQAEGNQVALANFRAKQTEILARLHALPPEAINEKLALSTKAQSYQEAIDMATGTGGAAPVKSLDELIEQAMRENAAAKPKEITPLTPLETTPPPSEPSERFNLPPFVIGGTVGSVGGYLFGGETDEERAYGAAKYGALGFGLGYIGHALPGIAKALELEVPVSKFGGISERGGILQLGSKVIQDETPLIKFKRDLAILQEQRMAGVQDPDLSRKIANLESLVQQFTPPEVPGTMIRVAGRPNELPSPFTHDQLPWKFPNARSEEPLESSAKVTTPGYFMGEPLEVSDKLQRQREAKFNAKEAKKKAIEEEKFASQKAIENSNVTNLKEKHAALVALHGGESTIPKAEPLDYENADWLDEEIAPIRPQGTKQLTVKQLETIQAKQSGMKKGKKSEGGYVTDQVRVLLPLVGTFTGAVTGGTLGYKESKGDIPSTILGATLGALAGGVLSTTALRLLMPELTKSQKAIVKQDTLGEALVKIFSEPAKDQAGKQVFGDPTEASKLLRALEKNGFKVPDSVKGKLTQAQGAVLQHVALLQSVVRRTKNFDVPDAVKAAATNFIEGESLNPSALKAEIIRQGGVDEAGWSVLKKAGVQPSDYHSWDVGNETFYMEPKTFEQVLKKTEEEFRSRVPVAFSDYADLMVTSRNSMNALQEAFALGLGGKRGQQIKSSIGKHIIKTYDFFEDPKFHPTREGIQIAAASESNAQKGRLIEKYIKGTAINDWRMMTEQTYQDALKSASPSQLVTLQKYKPIDFAGSIHPNMNAPAGKYYAGPDAFEKIRITSDETSLAQRIKQWTDDRKEDEIWGMIGQSRPEGKDFIDTNLLSKRNTFTPEFERHVLGVITDPFARMQHSINRLVESAVSSKYVDEIKNMTLPNGLKAAYENQSDYITARDALSNALNTAPPDQVREIQSKLNELLTYKNVDNTGLKLGVLKDAMVSRYVHDQLKNYNGTGLGVWDKLGGGIVQSFNRFAKMVHAPYNPIVQIQNIVTAPMHMWMGRAHPIDAWNAAHALLGKNEALYRELLREGIIGADEVTNAMTKHLHQVINSHYDNKALDKLLSPFQKIHEGITGVFRFPDTLTRAATYLSAKSRFAEKLRLPLDHPDVIANAVIWTDRYTVNHSNLSPIVKGLRKVPFVNIYIGYAAEMARIGKNLAEDVWKGDAFGDRMHAMAILGTLAGAAEGAQALSEAQLSPEDRKLWNQTQALSPDYSRSRYKFVTGKDKDNNFHYLDYTNLINTSAYNQMVRSIGSGDFEGFWAVNPVVGWQNTPAYRIIAEQIAGKNLSTQRDFRGFDDRVRSIAGSMLPSLTPSVGYEWQKWQQAINGEENMKTGRKETIEGQITKYLTSVGVTSVNSDTVKRNAFQKFQNEKALQRQYLNDVLKMKGIGEDVKNREINKYQEAIKYLTANLLDKIETPVPRD